MAQAQTPEQPLPPAASPPAEAPVEAETPPPAVDAPAEAPAEANAPAEQPETAPPPEAEAAAPAEVEAEAEADAAAEVETSEPAEPEPEAPAPAKAESEAPAEAEAAAPADAEAPAEAAAPEQADLPEEAAPVKAPEAEAPAETAPSAEANPETTEPAATEKKPAAPGKQPEQTDGGDVSGASDAAAPEDKDPLAEALAKEEEAAKKATEQTDAAPEPAATEQADPAKSEATGEDGLAEALAKEEKAAEEGAEQPDAAAEPAATEQADPAKSEATDEDGLAEALAKEEQAAEEPEQKPADPKAAEKADDTVSDESTAEAEKDAAAESPAKESSATESAAETDVPADLSALTAKDGEGEVTEEKVTEENSRSSSEDFKTSLDEASSGQEAQTSDDDDDNDLAKAALLGLGGIAIGAMLSNNREVELSTPDRVVVTHPDGSREVIKDEIALLRQPGSTVTTENFEDGSSRTTVTRSDGSQVVTIRDSELRVLRRSLVSADGTSTPLIDDTAAVVPVDIASLPAPAEPVQTTSGPLNEEELRAALLQDIDVGRQFTLGQIRNISEVRSLVAPINIDAITFDTGSAAIKSDQAKQLSTLGKVIQGAVQENPQEIFLIEGHTDTVGDAAMNLALSDRRAESVALALTEYFDVPPENLVTQGYGEQFPRVEAEGENRDNRRASVRRITELMQTASAE